MNASPSSEPQTSTEDDSPVPYPVDFWIVTVVTGGQNISTEQRQRVGEWLEANGIKPSTVSAQDGITVEHRQYGENQVVSRICFSQYALDESGQKFGEQDAEGVFDAVKISRRVVQSVDLAPDPLLQEWRDRNRERRLTAGAADGAANG